MENIKLALITKDQEYGRALGLALVEVYKNFTVTLYQSAPLHNELDRVDLILSDQEEQDTIRRNWIQLVEKASQADKNYEDKEFRLYKYSNVRQLAGELLFIYTILTGRKAAPMRNTNAKVIVFGSAEGGSGCTSAAIAFARELRRFHGKKVIYISLEEIESTLEYMKPFHNGNSISDYLYYLFNSNDSQHFPFLESFLVVDDYGIDAFMPSPGRNVLKTLTSEEMQYFISAVLDTGNYDAIIIDASDNLDKAALTCYEMANNVCFVVKDGACTYKEERFLEYISFLKGTEILDRIGKIINFASEKKENDEGGLLRVVSTLPNEPGSFVLQNGVKAVKADSIYAQKMKDLAISVLRNVIA